MFLGTLRGTKSNHFKILILTLSYPQKLWISLFERLSTQTQHAVSKEELKVKLPEPVQQGAYGYCVYIENLNWEDLDFDDDLQLVV